MQESPHSLEAEKHFISACLLEGSSTLVEAVSQDLSARMFYLPSHQIIYSRLLSILSAGKVMDLAVLSEELKSAGQLESVGGYPYLMDVSGSVPTNAKAGYFAQKIREMHTLRETIKEAQNLIEICRSGVDDVQESLSKPAERIMSLAAGSAIEREPSFEELVEQAENYRQTLIAEGGKPKGAVINFPWFQMDVALEPMQRGQLVVVGARPSIGKSSFVRQLACHTAMQGMNVYFVTLEVNPVQVVLQMASMMLKIGLKDLPKADVTHQVNFQHALHSMRKLGMHVSRRDRSLAQIIAKAKSIHARTPLSMVCVDYGGLIDDIASANKNDKIVQIGRVTKALKKLAGDIGCVVLLPWQLNRQMANDGNREPRLPDLRDSGDVEQDADKVLFIHRPSDNPVLKRPQPETAPRWEQPLFYQKVIQAKGRDDGTAEHPMFFERALAAFKPVEEIPKASEDLAF